LDNRPDLRHLFVRHHHCLRGLGCLDVRVMKLSAYLNSLKMKKPIKWTKPFFEGVSMSKEARAYLAAAIFLVATLGVTYFLVNNEINPTNRDVVIGLIAVITSGASIAVGKLFGTATDEQVQKLQKSLDDLQLEYDLLKNNYDSMTRMLVDRHVIAGDGIIFKPKD
jgi:hypothetical protein